MSRFVYDKLFSLLKSKGMKKTDLYAVVSRVTLAKLSKGQRISSKTLIKICAFLDCDVCDIVEIVFFE